MTDLHEPTIRACIDALDDNEQHYARDTLLALLPKPVDRAAELVEEFASDTSDAGGSELVPGKLNNEWVLKHFARWMLARQPEPVARKEWSEEDILREAINLMLDDGTERTGRQQACIMAGTAGEKQVAALSSAILRGIEMGRQLAPVARKEDSYCYGYAKRLAQHLVSKHWPENKSWEALPDLEGVLSQIDNMTTGFTLKPITLTYDEIVKEAREWCAKACNSTGFITGDKDDWSAMKTAIAILTAWKGKP